MGPSQAPPDITAALQGIDPKAELVHLGGQEWLLGVRGPNPAAQKKLEKKVMHQAPRPSGTDLAERLILDQQIAKEMQVLQLCADGFRPIHLYVVGPSAQGGITFGEVVRDFQLRDHNWRTRPEAAFRELRSAISFDEGNARRVERVREAMHQEAASLWKYVVKKVKHVLQPGRDAVNRAPVPSVHSVPPPSAS